MRTRDEVLREFSRPYQSHEDVGGPDADRMADHIVAVERQRDEYHAMWKAETFAKRELADRIRELEADAKRLDWLEESIAYIALHVGGDLRNRGHGWRNGELRAAIDHAMTPEVDRG